MRFWPAAVVLALVQVGCSQEVRTGEDAPALGGVGVPAASLVAGTAGNDGGQGRPIGAGGEGWSGAGVRLTTVLFSERDTEVRARMDGVVRSVLAELGDRVGQGQVLVVLEDDRERAEVEAAAATAERTRVEHERAAQLKEREILSQSELEDAVHRARVAEAALKAAEVRLEFTRARAPFAGVISGRTVRPGQNVAEGDPLYRVTVLRPLHALVRVPELAARQLEPGHRLRLVGLDGIEAEGVVARIAPAVDSRSGTVEVRVDVPEPGAMRPGSTVTVEIGTASPTPARTTR